MLLPVLPRCRGPSRRPNRSAQPHAVCSERVDPFRQGTEITSDKGWTPRVETALGAALVKRLHASGWTPSRRESGKRFTRLRRAVAWPVDPLATLGSRQPEAGWTRSGPEPRHRNGCRVSRAASASVERGWQARAESVRWGRGHVADGNMPRGMRAVGPNAAEKLFRRNRCQASPRHRCRAVGRQSFDETLAGRPDRPPNILLCFRHVHLPASAWRQTHLQSIGLRPMGGGDAQRLYLPVTRHARLARRRSTQKPGRSPAMVFEGRWRVNFKVARGNVETRASLRDTASPTRTFGGSNQSNGSYIFGVLVGKDAPRCQGLIRRASWV